MIQESLIAQFGKLSSLVPIYLLTAFNRQSSVSTNASFAAEYQRLQPRHSMASW